MVFATSFIFEINGEFTMTKKTGEFYFDSYLLD